MLSISILLCCQATVVECFLKYLYLLTLVLSETLQKCSVTLGQCLKLFYIFLFYGTMIFFFHFCVIALTMLTETFRSLEISSAVISTLCHFQLY